MGGFLLYVYVGAFTSQSPRRLEWAARLMESSRHILSTMRFLAFKTIANAAVSATNLLQQSEILNFSFLGNIIGKYIEKYIEICSIHVKISWEIKKTKARPSAAPLGVVFFISHDIFT